MADDELLDGFVREKVHGLWHASGSCRMGAAEDPTSVVDAEAVSMASRASASWTPP